MAARTHWITMHWPCPTFHWERHVYVHKQKTLPQPGDEVFLYEAKYAKIKGVQVKTVRRVHNGQHGPEESLPVGFGGIIGAMTVQSSVRDIAPTDVVYEYDKDNLPQWKIIPCRNFREARLPQVDLLKVLQMSPKTPAQVFRLCKITTEHAESLKSQLGLGTQ